VELKPWQNHLRVLLLPWLAAELAQLSRHDSPPGRTAAAA
jgi:hypothetical protein